MIDDFHKQLATGTVSAKDELIRKAIRATLGDGAVSDALQGKMSGRIKQINGPWEGTIINIDGEDVLWFGDIGIETEHRDHSVVMRSKFYYKFLLGSETMRDEENKAP